MRHLVRFSLVTIGSIWLLGILAINGLVPGLGSLVWDDLLFATVVVLMSVSGLAAALPLAKSVWRHCRNSDDT